MRFSLTSHHLPVLQLGINGKKFLSYIRLHYSQRKNLSIHCSKRFSGSKLLRLYSNLMLVPLHKLTLQFYDDMRDITV